MKKILNVAVVIFCFVYMMECSKDQEISEQDASQLKNSSRNAILEKTAQKYGGQKYEKGKVGGIWTTVINNDPKSFNTLTARDGDTGTITAVLFDYLADYDPYKKEWKPNLASFKVEVDEKIDKLRVIYTLRDDLYWTSADGKTKVKVTSDDAVFWYDEIEGDKNLQQPGYAQQFIEMKDGKTARITIEKIDDLNFAFSYPRIVANPVLSTNMNFGPKFIYQKVKKQGGSEALLKLFSIDTDPKTIPSIGQYYIYEYTPGVQVVLKRNPHYWKKDDHGTTLPYIETVIYKIVPDKNTEYLLFKEGKLDSYTVRPEDLDELLKKEKPDYTVYSGGATLGSGFLAFNQNPNSMDKKVNKWFKETKFRQAMSSMLNRKRIIEQVYRGLGEPAVYFFAKPNPYFDDKISQRFLFDPKIAVQLLEEIGIKKNKEGLMVDREGNKIEFELTIAAENNINIEIASIFSDELKNIGINAKVRPIDFQKIVDMITNTYDWQSTIVALGSNYWPSQGSNVWPSKGNFHIWYPLQKKPVTEWEARIDYLYNEGQFTLDEVKAKTIYDEYQQMILDQCPVLYLVHPMSFVAYKNKWGNIFYDTLDGTKIEYVYLKE